MFGNRSTCLRSTIDRDCRRGFAPNPNRGHGRALSRRHPSGSTGRTLSAGRLVLWRDNRSGDGPAVTKERRVSSYVGHHRYALISNQLREVLAWIQSVLNQHVASSLDLYL